MSQSNRNVTDDGTASDEVSRLAALRRYQILDTPPEPAFDRIVHLAALLLDVPIALISLVDADRQWFKARYGLEAPETPRTIAFCEHALCSSNILVVTDAKLDPRFSDNPLVTGEPHIRFYAGAPLVTHDGFKLGTICAIDRAPRDLNARDAAILAALSEQVLHELEVRAALGELYREVAEGRRAKRTLLGEGAKLESLLNATKSAVVTTDFDGQVASLNRVAELMFGYEPGEVIGRPIAALIADEAPGNGGSASALTRDGNGRRKDGSQFSVEVSRASWTDAQGCEASGAIVRDVTERRRAEAAAHTRDKLAALGRTAGGLAHELNNLLQPVIGLTQLELDQLPTDGTDEQMESRESLAMVLESGKQAREIVKKLLMFARKAKPPVTSVDVAAALAQVDLFGKEQPPGIRVDRIIDENAVGNSIINESELAEVMRILADNAAYAMDGCGTLTIRLDRVELADEAAALAMAPGPSFRITVADTGSGIEADVMTQMFEPFFTTKPVGQGTGLGVSVAYSVLRDWKGAIAVESTVGRGSTFTLYLPIAQTA